MANELEFGRAIDDRSPDDRSPYGCRIYRGIDPAGPQPGCGFNR